MEGRWNLADQTSIHEIEDGEVFSDALKGLFHIVFDGDVTAPRTLFLFHFNPRLTVMKQDSDFIIELSDLANVELEGTRKTS